MEADFQFIQQDLGYSNQRNRPPRKSRALKKKQRIQKLLKLYDDPEHKKVEKEKRKKREKQKLDKQLAGKSEQEKDQYLRNKKEVKKMLKQKLIQSTKSGLPILIDCVYEEAMNPKQRKSLAIQIELITKSMRRMQYPCALHLCNMGSSIQQALIRMRYQFWPLTAHKQNILEVAKELNKQIIYLSPDAEQQLTQVSYDYAYVIGGLVDRTILKNASLQRSNQLKVKVRKLPIDKLMQNRKCLNLDHVALILCKWLECKQWVQAFEFGAPKRFKRQQQKNSEKQSSSNSQKDQESSQEQNQVHNQISCKLNDLNID